MNPKKSLSLNAQILIGMFAGVACGIFLNKTGTDSKTASVLLYWGHLFGKAFMNLLLMIVVPLVFTSIVLGIGNLRAHTKMGKVWKCSLAYFVLTTALSILLGMTLVNLVQPGKGLALPLFQKSMEQGVELQNLTSSQQVTMIFTENFKNPVWAMANGKILPTLVFAIFLGIALVSAGDRANKLFGLIKELFELIMIIVGWILKLAPIGIMGLLMEMIASADPDLFQNLAKFIGIVLFGLLFHGLVVLPSLLFFFTKKTPLTFFKGISTAVINAFSTCSSSATLPVTMTCVEENLDGDKNIAGFVLPLGATINMDGTALYEAVAAIFVANLVGIDLNFGQQMVVFFTSILAAMGAPGIPSAGMVTMVMVLQAVGLPGEAVAILYPIDRFLDAFRTSINVEGDAIGSLIVTSLCSDDS